MKFDPFLTNTPIFIPPENTRKPNVFFGVFREQGVWYGNIGQEWVSWYVNEDSDLFEILNYNISTCKKLRATLIHSFFTIKFNIYALTNLSLVSWALVSFYPKNLWKYSFVELLI